MEQWEIELRQKLNDELPEGGYQIGEEPFILWTGKGGKIEFEVALRKKLDEMIYDEDTPTFVAIPPYDKDKIDKFFKKYLYVNTKNKENNKD